MVLPLPPTSATPSCILIKHRLAYSKSALKWVGMISKTVWCFIRYPSAPTYRVCAQVLWHQLASVVAWQDEAHVEANRVLYRQKFDLFLSELGDRLPLKKPDAGFYFWLPVDNDECFARQLYSEANITVLAGRYLSRETQDGNPGANHVRMALVADIAQCEQAIERIKRVIGK